MHESDWVSSFSARPLSRSSLWSYVYLWFKQLWFVLRLEGELETLCSAKPGQLGLALVVALNETVCLGRIFGM